MAPTITVVTAIGAVVLAYLRGRQYGRVDGYEHGRVDGAVAGWKAGSQHGIDYATNRAADINIRVFEKLGIEPEDLEVALVEIDQEQNLKELRDANMSVRELANLWLRS